MRPGTREALVAVDVLGLSYREAARALSVGEATITTRLFRARKQVAQRLAPDSAEGSAPIGLPEQASGSHDREGAHASIAARGGREQSRAPGVLPSRESP